MNICIVEHVSGVWSYHLADFDKSKVTSLCARGPMMPSPAPLRTWGFRGNVPAKYCRECAEAARERGVELPEAP